MRTRTIRLVRRTVGLVWAALLLGLLILVGVNQVAPRLGYQTLIIRGGSMEPAIPLGSLIAIERVDPASLVRGDVITVRSPSGVVYSHRIVSVDGSQADRRFQVRGDNNASPDDAPVPAQAILGRVTFHAPILGSLLTTLALPIGMLSILVSLASLLLAYWLLEGIERHLARGQERAQGRVPAEPPFLAEGG